MKRISMLVSAVLSVAALLLGAVGARASEPPTPFRCNSAKIKCATAKTTGILDCHRKAEGKGVAVDPACTQRAKDKYDGGATPARGCFEKAEAKQPCTTNGDVTSIEAKVDAFISDVVTELDPDYPAAVLSKCSAGKKKCVATKAKALLGCYAKAAGKNLPVDAACIQKAQAKFDGGADPGRGCFAKLEARTPNDCLTSGDTTALEDKADAFALDVYSELTSTVPAILDFTLSFSGGNCGNARDGANGVIKSLTCGGLDFGGGASIIPETAVPDGSTSRFILDCALSPCTLDPTSTVPVPNSAVPDCTDTGCNFGTPFPIPNPGIPHLSTCLLNTFSTPAGGTLDLATGASGMTVDLASDTYLTGNVAGPCPRCSASGSPASPGHGTCDRGPRAGQACTSTSSTGLTRDCLTGGADATHSCLAGVPGMDSCIDGIHVGLSSITLSELSTGLSTMTNAAGDFCPGQGGTPGMAGCFGLPACRTINAQGAAAGPVVNGVPSPVTLASVFCMPATASGLLNFPADLPGPAAVSLPGMYEAHN